MDHVQRSRPSRSPGEVDHSFAFLSISKLILCVCFVCADTTTIKTRKNTNMHNTADPLQISDFCPLAAYLFKQKEHNNTFILNNVSGCKYSMPDFTAHQGVVYGMCDDSTKFCLGHVEVLLGMFVRAHIQRLAYWCVSSYWDMRIFLDSKPSPAKSFTSNFIYRLGCDCHSREERFVESSGHHMYLLNYNVPMVKLNIEAVPNHTFISVYTSAHSGHVFLPLQKFPDMESYAIWEILQAPPAYVIMVSFRGTDEFLDCEIHTELIYQEQKENTKSVLRVCDENTSPATVLPTAYLQLHVEKTRFHYYYKISSDNSRLVVLFSFHPWTATPRKLLSGLFNCSVEHYASFRHHLDCNMKLECEYHKDETEHCPFSSPSCQGLVASRNKCFRFIRLTSGIKYSLMTSQCQKMGEKLASVKTRKEQEDLLPIFKHHEEFSVYVGYSSGWDSVPFMYSKFRKWLDNTFIYNLNHFKQYERYNPKRTVRFLTELKSMTLYLLMPLEFIMHTNLLCEAKPQSANLLLVQTVELPEVHHPLSIFTQTTQVFLVCVESHFTYTFLSCDPCSRCGQTSYPRLCAFWDMTTEEKSMQAFPDKSIANTVPMFVCDDDITTVPYTLVCDFRQDCPDNSDESFCEHPLCSGFLCNDKRCILISQRCNEYSDCMDNSDEVNCLVEHTSMTPAREANKNQQIFILHDGAGYFIQQVMEPGKRCPDTHYNCTTDWLYCLPVYTRCNGFADCTYGEDEQDCGIFTCPGFYRCRGSRVCIHGDHLCDGWGQCPQRDDEWSCDMTCPESCLCQGQSFLCPQFFSSDLFPQLRSLDATGSGMTLADFRSNPYLIHISLSYCSLVNITVVKHYNLQCIDLSNNKLETVNMDAFFELPNLRILLLANNPLSSIKYILLKVIHYALRKVDLSRTCLVTFHIDLYKHLPQLECLNLSFSAIETIGSASFKSTPKLTELDLRRNPVNNFALDTLSKLNKLKLLFSSNYRLCCKNLLPKESNRIRCLTPPPLLSSCNKLLPSETYRLAFWLISVLSIFGNLICLVALFTKTMPGSNDTVFIAHLLSSYICMGIHVNTVTLANEIFRGEYIHFEKTWTNNVHCKVAGFLSSLSSEVSILLIWLITVDHIIVLCFPVTKWRFNKNKTFVVCVVTWLCGILLSVIPFLPGMKHWQLYSQSGLCRLTHFDHYNYNQEFGWFTVTVTFNCLLSACIVAGQIMIHTRTPKYLILTDSNMRSIYSSAPLLEKVAVTDAIYRFTFGLFSFLTRSESGVSHNFSMAIVFMFPLNSALTPMFYVWTLATQHQKQAREERLVQLFKSRLQTSMKHIHVT